MEPNGNQFVFLFNIEFGNAKSWNVPFCRPSLPAPIGSEQLREHTLPSLGGHGTMPELP
jgi:hypothetical protein